MSTQFFILLFLFYLILFLFYLILLFIYLFILIKIIKKNYDEK
jgi:hypothetical protein